MDIYDHNSVARSLAAFRLTISSEANSNHGPVYLRRGIAAFQLGNMADAEVALAKATQLDPSPQA